MVCGHQPASQISEQIGDARILRKQRRHWIGSERFGMKCRLKNLGVPLQVAVDVHGPRVHLQRAVESKKAEQACKETKKAVGKKRS